MDEISQPRKDNSLFWKLIIASLFAFICLTGITASVVGIGFWVGFSNRDTTPIVASIPTPQPYNQIAYVGNDNNIWVVAPDGKQRRQLTTDNRAYRLPTWSPNNEYVAFVGLDSDTGEVARSCCIG
jgi:Tol biopolymer transport system component